MSDKQKTESTEPMKTNVKGYFNPNPYRVNVSISELGGLSVQLGPQEFIMDRVTNKKINDPILDRYVGFKMLSPELSNAPVPVILIPKMPTPTQSAHSVGVGVKDAQGKWHIPPPQPEQSLVKVPPSVSKPSVTGMTMAQARERGLVGKTRLVADDYGAAETDGAPTRGDAIPPIRYAIESTPRAAQARPGQLPPELEEQVNPVVAPILAGLKAAAAQDPERINLGRKAAEQAVREQQGDAGVQKFRASAKAIKVAQRQLPAPVVATPVVATPAPAPTPAPAAPAPVPRRRRVARVVAVPAPPPEALLEVAPQSPLIGGRPADLPPPDLEESVPAPQSEPPPTAEDRADGRPHRCGACGEEFRYKSYLRRHISRAHKDRLAELMPPD